MWLNVMNNKRIKNLLQSEARINAQRAFTKRMKNLPIISPQNPFCTILSQFCIISAPWGALPYSINPPLADEKNLKSHKHVSVRLFFPFFQCPRHFFLSVSGLYNFFLSVSVFLFYSLSLCAMDIHTTPFFVIMCHKHTSHYVIISHHVAECDE